MRRALVFPLAAFAIALLPACGGGAKGKGASAPSGGATSCGQVAAHVIAYGELLEETGANSKARVTSYAGILELLISFERASLDLETQLAAMKIDDSSLAGEVKKARAELQRAAEFAKTERAAIEKHAHDVAPLAKETQEAWGVLRTTCAKGGPTDCGGVREALAKFDAAETENHHDRVIGDLANLRITTPALAKARDRAVAASKNVQAAIAARSKAAEGMPKKWAEVQKGVSQSIEGIAKQCKETAIPSAEFLAADRPDPRKLTVLLKVKPPAGVERSLIELSRSATDEDEKAFYEARAKGAFGSGFIIVRAKPGGSGNETLIITNRHVVELGDKAQLELADGTSLGTADILYTDSVHDVAVLRPSGKVPFEQGFAFAEKPAKDQQPVVATGFPGMVGRPSYQTTKGYVSNESFRIDESGSRQTLVQHTAPIDPGSSGGPLTDEKGHVLGVNTLKVTNREAVGLAVPSSSILEAIRRADNSEARRTSAEHRKAAARLACLGFVGELAMTQPRMLVLEPMISNHLTSVEGMEDAAALSGDDTFERVWLADSVRAMRIATLMRVRAGFASGGGVSVLETCDEQKEGDGQADVVRFRVRLANFEMRDMALKWEQGHFKIAGFQGPTRTFVDPTPPPPPPAKPGKPARPPIPKKGSQPPRPKK